MLLPRVELVGGLDRFLNALAEVQAEALVRVPAMAVLLASRPRAPPARGLAPRAVELPVRAAHGDPLQVRRTASQCVRRERVVLKVQAVHDLVLLLLHGGRVGPVVRRKLRLHDAGRGLAPPARATSSRHRFGCATLARYGVCRSKKKKNGPLPESRCERIRE